METLSQAILKLNLLQKHSQFLLNIFIRLNLFEVLALKTDNLCASDNHKTYGFALVTNKVIASFVLIGLDYGKALTNLVIASFVLGR